MKKQMPLASRERRLDEARICATRLSYNYFPNGDVETRTNNLYTGRTVNYAYDALNRVISGKTQATSGTDCWGQTIPSGGYDQYGNLSIINVSQCSAPSLNLSINTGTNQINSTGFTYDAAGDLTADGQYTYAWNGAGLLKSAGGVTYTYDGNGNRVEKSSGTLYWRGLDGNVLAETDASGNTLDEYVYFDGSRIARRDASGNVYYYFPDTLGSEVSITNATGTTCFDADFYLFGGEKVFTNNCPPSYMFAGMERDSETGLDHTPNRQYSSQYGRWLSPDPMGGDIMNPQSLNRYSYALNNPTTLTDPLGLSGGNPADLCSASGFADSNARCQGPPTCSFYGDPNCGYGGCQNINNDNEAFCDMWTQYQYPPLGQWNPLPRIIPPTAADQLGALGIGNALRPLPDPGIVEGPWVFRVITLARLTLPCTLGLGPCVASMTGGGGPKPAVPTSTKSQPRTFQFPPSPLNRFAACTAVNTGLLQSCLFDSCLPFAKYPDVGPYAAATCGTVCGLAYWNRQKFCKKLGGIK